MTTQDNSNKRSYTSTASDLAFEGLRFAGTGMAVGLAAGMARKETWRKAKGYGYLEYEKKGVKALAGQDAIVKTGCIK